MSDYQELISKVIRNIEGKKDITYLISTQDQHTAMISTKQGELSYLRYGSLCGVEALNAFLNIKIKSVSERQHSLKHSDSQHSLPSTNEIIKKLCINLPEILQEEESTHKSLEEYSTRSSFVRNSVNSSKTADLSTQSKAEVSRAVLPIEPRIANISNDMIQAVKAALQQSVGPISGLIYEDACSEIDQLNSRNDLACLIRILIDEIDENQYQNQFIRIINEQLVGIILIQE